MTASILDHLDRLADEHPDKLLYSYLDVNGDPIETYTYASFLRPSTSDRRTFAERLSFRGGRSASACLPAGARNDLRIFWLRARRIDPRAGLSPQFARLPERSVQDGPHRKGLPGGWDLNEQRLPRISQDESRQTWSRGVGRRRRLHFRSSVDRHGRFRGHDFGPTTCQSFEYLVSPVHVGFDDGAQGRDGDA